ncbi:hypothetical protein SETIT_8G096800v2 [Setaria italica]|uniref:Dirigent protein n=2 Tax=Setaria italica TaxID=4555 RepID=A0A368S5Z6_SETIT|nr:hypothetical protein SETIT_8G096800v2 [Setaria italica]
MFKKDRIANICTIRPHVRMKSLKRVETGYAGVVYKHGYATEQTHYQGRKQNLSLKAQASNPPSIMMPSLPSVFLSAAFLLAAAAYIRSSGTVGSSTATSTTHLHFFMHDDYTGPRPTAARIVSGRSLLPTLASSSDGDDNATATGSTLSRLLSSPRQFGDVVVLNNALTEGPGGDSARVGTAQGFAVRVSEGGIVSHLTMHMVLDAGEHRGSSVTANGRIDMDATVRESVVIGGTGKFRFARGYMLTRNYDYDLARGGIVEIDVYVQH